MLDLAHLAERAKRRGWSVVCLDVAVTTSTPRGELVANIATDVAQGERHIIGACTSEGLQADESVSVPRRRARVRALPLVPTGREPVIA